MRFTTAALVAGLATLSNAFLIPPTGFDDLINEPQLKFHKDKHGKGSAESLPLKKTAVIEVDCPGCPYATKYSEERSDGPAQQGIEWTEGIENKIHLEFDIDTAGLRVNSHQIWPLSSLLSGPGVRASQVRTDTHEHSVEIPISFALEESRPIQYPGAPFVISSLRLMILGLNGVPVKVDTIIIEVFKDPQNENYITSPHTVPFELNPGGQRPNVCDTSDNFCRLQALVASHLKSIMDTFRANAAKARSWIAKKHGAKAHGKGHGCGKSKPKHHGDHHGDRHDKHHDAHPPHHKHHRHHHRMHRLSHLLRKTLRFFIIPALLGVCGGLAASAIGMLTGRAIVYLWCKFARGGQRGPLRLRETEIIIADDEKEGLLIAEVVVEADDPAEAPPRYTDIEATALEVVTEPVEKE